MSLAATLAIILVSGLRFWKNSNTIGATKTFSIAVTEHVVGSGSPLSHEEYVLFFQSLVAHGRAEALCEIRLHSGCENLLIKRVDKYENHGLIPQGVLCSESPDAPYFSDFCAFAHYRCSKKKYYLKRVSCPGDVWNEGTIMTQKDNPVQYEEDLSVKPLDDDDDVLEITSPLDVNPVAQTILDDLMFGISIQSSTGLTDMPPEGNLKGASEVADNDDYGQFDINTLRVRPAKKTTEETTFLTLSWPTTIGILDEPLPDETTLFHRGNGAPVTPSQEIVEDIAFPSSINDEFIVSDDDILLSTDIVHQSRTSAVQRTPGEELESSNSIISGQDQSFLNDILTTMPSKKVAVRKTAVSNARLPSKMFLKTIPRQRNMVMPRGTIVEGRVVEGISRLPTTQVPLTPEALDDEPLFINRQPIDRSIVGPTLTTKITTGVIFSQGRSQRFPKRMDVVQQHASILDGAINNESAQQQPPVKISAKEPRIRQRIRQQIVPSVPKERISEATVGEKVVQRRPKLQVIQLQFTTRPHITSADVTIPDEEAIFSQSIPPLAPKRTLDTAVLTGMLFPHTTDQWQKQTHSHLVTRRGFLEIEPEKGLLDVNAADQGHQQQQTSSVAMMVPRHKITIQTTHANGEVSPSPFHQQTYYRTKGVEAIGGKVFNSSISLENTGPFSCRDPSNGSPCTPTIKELTATYTKFPIGSTSQKLWRFDITSSSAKSRLANPSPQNNMLDSITTSLMQASNRSTGKNRNFQIVINNIKIPYDYTAKKGTLTNLAKPKIDVDYLVGLLTSSMTTSVSKQSPGRQNTVTTSATFAILTGFFNSPKAQDREPESKKPRSSDTVLHMYGPLDAQRVTLARSRSGGEIWRSDIADLYRRLQDPNVQRLSNELRRKLIAQGSGKGKAGAKQASLKKLSLQLMNAMSRLSVRR
ncbi:acrosin-binding protein [Ambystoma mexicanum]|uniref:acrosin-binding protein n=1 Tax=Ambystoma mexicanum TaxID=8296 RepID=UPI0037E8AC39